MWLVELQESMEIWGGLKLSTEELMLNCRKVEKTESPLDCVWSTKPFSEVENLVLGFLRREWCLLEPVLGHSRRVDHRKKIWCWEIGRGGVFHRMKHDGITDQYGVGGIRSIWTGALVRQHSMGCKPDTTSWAWAELKFDRELAVQCFIRLFLIMAG